MRVRVAVSARGARVRQRARHDARPKAPSRTDACPEERQKRRLERRRLSAHTAPHGGERCRARSDTETTLCRPPTKKEYFDERRARRESEKTALTTLSSRPQLFSTQNIASALHARTLTVNVPRAGRWGAACGLSSHTAVSCAGRRAAARRTPRAPALRAALSLSPLLGRSAAHSSAAAAAGPHRPLSRAWGRTPRRATVQSARVGI